MKALLALLFSVPAAAVPVNVAWQVPLNPNETYTLQVAREPGFATLVLNRQVNGNGFSWDTPGEGVYHWRLLRPGKTGRGVEGSTFVSGSFVAVMNGERKKPARVGWQPTPGADRYKVYLVDAEGRTRTMISATTFFTLPTLERPVMVEVVPYSGGQRTFRDYHFQPGLTFGGGDKPEGAPAATGALVAAGATGAAAASAPAGAAGVVKSPGAVGAFKPPLSPVKLPPAKTEGELAEVGNAAKPAEPAPPPTEPATGEKPAEKPDGGTEAAIVPPDTSAAPAPEVASNGPARRKKHMVYGLFFNEEDKINFTKLEIDLKSRENVFGAGAGFWLNPVGGLIVSGLAQYHEHKGVMTQESRFPDEKILMEQARYTATVDIGFNFLTLFDVEHHVLSLAVTGAGTQVPSLPVVFDGSDPERTPTVEKRPYNLIGGTLAYGWLGESFGVMLDGTATQASEDEAKMFQGKLVLDFYPSERFGILVGAFARRFEMTRCHSDAATCLLEGKVRTSTREAGGFVGLGAVFM